MAKKKSTPEETPVADLTKAAAKKELAQLAEAIRAADAAYYQEDAPHMSDADYDALRQRLNAIEEHFPELKSGGQPERKRGLCAGAGGSARSRT